MTRSSCPALPASTRTATSRPTFADEARQAWQNVAAILERAGASISDIVSIRQYLTREEDIKTYVAVQKEMITHEPAGMLLVPTAMVWPEIHVEVEAVALVPSGR
jgi:2-iminobutanoate/2-iminopropanoate deaminase